ncbi:MAG: sensor histidine kinase, partial [Candidatus Binatia bacterium]
TSLNEIVDHVLRHQESMARAREISIEAALAQDLPKLPLDRRHIDRVVANLLSNAIKYSPARSRIRVGTACENGRVLLAVRDQGPGIPADQVPHLFERYRRLGSGRIDGSGLGLYIVKRIVEAHGGRVRVDCPADGGSLFEVSFAERSLAA